MPPVYTDTPSDYNDIIFYLGEPVFSQRRDLLEQLQDFYEPDVLPATQPESITGKRNGLVVFCFTYVMNLTTYVVLRPFSSYIQVKGQT